MFLNSKAVWNAGVLYSNASGLNDTPPLMQTFHPLVSVTAVGCHLTRSNAPDVRPRVLFYSGRESVRCWCAAADYSCCCAEWRDERRDG